MSFYVAYAGAVLNYEWMRIFMFSGLAGERINARYLDHLRTHMLEPMLEEIAVETTEERLPELEDVWNLHGSIVYLGVRKFVYRSQVPDDFRPHIERAVDRFLRGFDIPCKIDGLGIDATELTCITEDNPLQA